MWYYQQKEREEGEYRRLYTAYIEQGVKRSNPPVIPVRIAYAGVAGRSNAAHPSHRSRSVAVRTPRRSGPRGRTPSGVPRGRGRRRPRRTAAPARTGGTHAGRERESDEPPREPSTSRPRRPTCRRRRALVPIPIIGLITPSRGRERRRPRRSPGGVGGRDFPMSYGEFAEAPYIVTTWTTARVDVAPTLDDPGPRPTRWHRRRRLGPGFLHGGDRLDGLRLDGRTRRDDDRRLRAFGPQSLQDPLAVDSGGPGRTPPRRGPGRRRSGRAGGGSPVPTRRRRRGPSAPAGRRRRSPRYAARRRGRPRPAECRRRVAFRGPKPNRRRSDPMRRAPVPASFWLGRPAGPTPRRHRVPTSDAVNVDSTRCAVPRRSSSERDWCDLSSSSASSRMIVSRGTW